MRLRQWMTAAKSSYGGTVQTLDWLTIMDNSVHDREPTVKSWSVSQST
jgi:hypothetical protein